MRLKYIIKFSTVITFILPLFFLIQTTSLQTASAVEYQHSKNHQAVKTGTTGVMKKQTDKTLTHDEVIDITDKFEDMLVQESDDKFKVINFHTKDELLDAFKEIASRDVATRYVDFYFNEEPEGLYIVPTELPPWLNEENDYDMIQLEENKVKVIQENNSNFYGDYTVSIEFTFDNEWKITNIVYS